MELAGHSDPVYCMGFDPSGKILASGSKDKRICECGWRLGSQTNDQPLFLNRTTTEPFAHLRLLAVLWETQDKCSNFAMLQGHKGSVLELAWATDGAAIYSASADKTAAVWDTERRQKRRALKDHDDFVYSIACARRGPELVVTGCEDGEARLWDVRDGSKRPAMSVQHAMPCLAVEFSDDASAFYTGCLDEAVRQWDIRQPKGPGGSASSSSSAAAGEPAPSLELHGHAGMVTCLRLSPDGKSLLSNSADGTLRSWDVRPFAVLGRRCQRQFAGASHGRGMQLLGCAWSPDGLTVSSGSTNGTCLLWDYESDQSLSAAATSTAALIAVVKAGQGAGGGAPAGSGSVQGAVPVADAGMVAAQVEGSLHGASPSMRLPGHRGAVYRCEFSPSEPVVATSSEDGRILLGELPDLRAGAAAAAAGEEDSRHDPEDGIVATSASSGAGAGS